MKKIAYGISFLALIGITIISCQKDNIDSVTSELITDVSSSDQNSSNTDNTSEAKANLYHFVDNFPSLGDWGCYKPAQNCLPTVIIRPSRAAYLELEEAIDLSDDENFELLQLFFSSGEWETVFPSLNPEIAENIAGGEFKMTRKMDAGNENSEIFVVIGVEENIVDFNAENIVQAIKADISELQ